MITQEELKEILHYDPETGIFTWRVRPSTKIKAGSKAGRKDKKSNRIKIKGKSYETRHLAWIYMTGEWPKPKHYITTLDNDRYNDAWNNLNEMSVGDFRRKKGTGQESPTGVHGVRWDKEAKKYRASLKFNGKMHNIGIYPTIRQAELARIEFEKQHGIKREDNDPCI